MNDFISESLCGVRDATIDAVYNKFEDGRLFPPPELWTNMAVRFGNPAIVALTNSVQRAIQSDRDEQGPEVHSYWKHPWRFWWRFCITNILGWR